MAKLTEIRSTGVKIDYRQMTIEHIAAQNPTANRLTEQSIAQLRNLIYLDHELNRKLANKQFPEKKPILKKSKVWLDEIILNAADWGSDEIYQRTQKLADISYKEIWKL